MKISPFTKGTYTSHRGINSCITFCNFVVRSYSLSGQISGRSTKITKNNTLKREKRKGSAPHLNQNTLRLNEKKIIETVKHRTLK